MPRHHLQVGDFAILLRAGFDRWSAARMQLSTALVGVLGACVALCAQSPQGTGEFIHSHMRCCCCLLPVTLLFPVISRKCYFLDIAFHLWRLPLHSLGERGA